MIRVFVGVRIDPEVADRIFAAQDQLRERLSGVRWVPEANFHFTLKFLGPIDESRAAAISAALTEALARFSQFGIFARAIGVFPDIRRPRVIWVGLDSTELQVLAASVETALEHIGFAGEQRAFKPHLTLGRWRAPGRQNANLARELEPWKDYSFGSSVVKEVVLFQSLLKPQGAVYNALQVFPLQADARRA